jgi:hypothetical protein
MQTTTEIRAARIARTRRRRTVALLGSGALGSLAASVITGSTVWLSVTILFDVLLAGFVTVLLQVKAARFTSVAPVVELDLTSQAEELTEVAVVPTIRIVGA